MHNPLSPQSVHARAASSLAEWSRTDRSYDQVAGILGIGHASVFRRVTCEVDWTLTDFIRAVCHAERIEGDPSLLDQFVADIRTNRSSAMGAVRNVTELVAAMGGEIQALVERVADQRIDRAEAQDTYNEASRLRHLLEQLQASCLTITEGEA